MKNNSIKKKEIVLSNFGYQTNPINDKMKRVMILYTLRINSQTGNITEISGVYKTQK